MSNQGNDPRQGVDTRVLEQTRLEVQRILAEIDHLAQQDMPPGEFYQEFTRRAHLALAAHAAALWVRGPQGHLQLAHQVNLAGTGVQADQESIAAHQELLRFLVARGQPVLLGPRARIGDAETGGEGVLASNPTDYLLVLAPVLIEGQVAGVMEVFQDAERRGAAHVGFVRLLTRIAGEAAKYIKNRQFRQFVGQEKVWNQLDAFIRAVHSGLNPKQTAYLIANDGKRLTGAERVSVALLKNKRTARIEAISGQDTVEQKSNLVRRMGKLASVVLRHGEPLIYSGVVEGHWPRNLTAALQAYLEESPSRFLAVVPMPDRRRQQPGGVAAKPRAALIAEMIEDDVLPDELVGKVDVVIRHGSLAFYNAVEHHEVFLLPLWKLLGRASSAVFGSRLPTTIAVMALATLLILFFVFFPWTLWLEGKGELVPKTRRTIFAPVAGMVETIKVDHGVRVSRNYELLEMSNPQLTRDREAANSELLAKGDRLQNLKTLQEEYRRARKSEEGNVNAQIAELQTEIRSIAEHRRQLDAQLAELRLKAPIDGKVLNWNPKEKLLRRPVQAGDPLLEIGDTEREWIVEVRFPEKVVAHVAKAKADAPDRRPRVTFIISSEPEAHYEGTLVELATQATPVDGQNVVAAKVALARPLPDQDRRPSGAEVRVKVECGRYPVGYVLFREVIDFVRERVFF